MVVEKVENMAADSWISELELTRSQKSGVAISFVIAVALAILVAILLVGPVLNILGLQAVGA